MNGAPLHPAELWEHLVQAGLSKGAATRHVLLRVANTPEKVQAAYLKDIDPGKLASFGLGAADMASFGLGDQAARAIWGQEATDTQQAAEQLHPTAHLAGEIAGVLSPFAIERGLAAAGVKLAPTAIGAAVQGIRSTVGRAAAKTALNAATGAAYAGAQAAGRTEGGVAPRLAAARQAAIPGAVAGGLLPIGAAALGAAGSKVLGPVLKRVAGAGPAVAKAAAVAGEATTAAPGLLGAADTPEELAVAKQLGLPLDAVRGRVGQAAVAASQARPGLLTPSAPPPIDPLATAPALRGSQLSQLGRGETLPYYPRGGQAEQALAPPPIVSPPVLGPANPEVIARNASHAQLMQALENPQTSMRIRQVILAELQRRGIVGPGLLTPLPQ